MILGILGLLGFAPIGLAVLFGLFVGGIGVIGRLLTAAIEILSALGSGAFSVGGVAIGIVIGLLLYNRNRKGAADRNEAERRPLRFMRLRKYRSAAGSQGSLMRSTRWIRCMHAISA